MTSPVDDPFTIVQPPAPGVALLRCRCGRMLDTTQMRWCRRPRRLWQTTAVIPPISCKTCAKAAVALADLLDGAA